MTFVIHIYPNQVTLYDFIIHIYELSYSFVVVTENRKVNNKIMNEEQANKIITLLSEILDKLPKKTSTDLDHLYNAIDDVKSSVDKIVVSIDNLDIS